MSNIKRYLVIAGETGRDIQSTDNLHGTLYHAWFNMGRGHNIIDTRKGLFATGIKSGKFTWAPIGTIPDIPHGVGLVGG